MRIIAEVSGWVIAHDFGIISPTTMCRNTTTTIAMVNAIGCAAASSPRCASGTSMRCARAGSASAPRPTVQAVIPNCAPASMIDRRLVPRSAARAVREPSCSSRCGREATSANSAATKKALAISRNSEIHSAGAVLIGPPDQLPPAAAAVRSPAAHGESRRRPRAAPPRARRPHRRFRFRFRVRRRRRHRDGPRAPTRP